MHGSGGHSAASSGRCFQGLHLRGRSRCPRWRGRKLSGTWRAEAILCSPESPSGIKPFPSPGRDQEAPGARPLLSTHHLEPLSGASATRQTGQLYLALSREKARGWRPRQGLGGGWRVQGRLLGEPASSTSQLSSWSCLLLLPDNDGQRKTRRLPHPTGVCLAQPHRDTQPGGGGTCLSASAKVPLRGDGHVGFSFICALAPSPRSCPIFSVLVWAPHFALHCSAAQLSQPLCLGLPGSQARPELHQDLWVQLQVTLPTLPPGLEGRLQPGASSLHFSLLRCHQRPC